MVSMKAMPKPRNHPFEAGRVSTMALIFSVTVPKVWPGSITGARSRSVDVLYCSGILVRYIPQGLKPYFYLFAVRGAKAPLFHGSFSPWFVLSSARSLLGAAALCADRTAEAAVAT